jgi:hypothetical protein
MPKSRRLHKTRVFKFITIKLIGGKGGIRTLGTVARTLLFESSTFNHSVTFP